MFQIFKKCLFCAKPLPNVVKGEGEHVIPKNIYGFWRIPAICNECKEYFGNSVDHLAIKHPIILEAMQEIGLPKTGAYLENLPYKGVDTKDGRTLNMLKRGNKYKIKSNHHNDDIFECAEEDWEKVNVERIRAIVGGTILSKEFDTEIKRIKQEYKKIEPGGSVESPKLGFSFRKRQVSNVELSVSELPSITPLIAKIVICFLYYAVPPNQIMTLNRLDMFSKHARFGNKLEEFSINWCPLYKKKVFEKSHFIRLNVFRNHLFVDVTFFGWVNWRANLMSDENISIINPKKENCDSISMFLDFADLQKRELFTGYRKLDSSSYEFWRLM